MSQIRRNHKINRWELHFLNQAKLRSKKNGLMFDLDAEFILNLIEIQDWRCYWFGFKMEPYSADNNPLQPSLDRLDNSKGYTKDNVVICSLMANYGRNSNDVDNWDQILRKIEFGKYSKNYKNNLNLKYIQSEFDFKIENYP